MSWLAEYVMNTKIVTFEGTIMVALPGSSLHNNLSLLSMFSSLDKQNLTSIITSRSNIKLEWAKSTNAESLRFSIDSNDLLVLKRDYSSHENTKKKYSTSPSNNAPGMPDVPFCSSLFGLSFVPPAP